MSLLPWSVLLNASIISGQFTTYYASHLGIFCLGSFIGDQDITKDCEEYLRESLNVGTVSLVVKLVLLRR